MKRAVLFCGLLIAILSLMAFGCAKPAPTSTPAELPEYLNLATPPAGMIINTQASGIAALISAYTPINCKVIAYTNEQVWIPMMVTGEVDLGIANMVEPYLAYLGKPAFDALAKAAGLKGFPIRLIVRGDPLIGSLMVRGNSPAKTIPDLRGKIVNNMWPAQPGVHLLNQGLLANGGLTYDDVQSMPFPGVVPAANAVMEGRCEAVIASIDAPFSTQAVAAVKARWLPLDPSPEAVKRMEQAFPGLYLLKGEKRATIPDLPEYLMAWDTSVTCRQNLPDDVAYLITKTLWEKNAVLLATPTLSKWTKERFCSTKSTIPYHDGAIKFYKEVGVWTNEMDAWQKALLAQQPK